MADLVEDIKNKLDIVDVISGYLPLKKTGANFKCLSPFTTEKTPSFVVSPEKQIFHCFSTGKGGDMFTFVQEYEGVSFAESLQILADRAGLKTENYKTRKKLLDKSEKDEYYEAHEVAADFLEKQLWDSADGGKVLEYLHRRGLKDETIREFRLGFAPDSYDAMYPSMLKKGISRQVLLKSGFVSSKNITDDNIYDKFRGRLMFPIFDYFGRICGFGGRALKDGQSPKYLNSPENIIYSKSKVLYGMSHAKQAVKDSGEVLIVEGYFDVLLPYQEGIKNVVASSGTAFTLEHAHIIKRLTSRVLTCFDTDKAGFEATRRAYAVMSAEDIAVKVVEGLDKKDPADFVLAHAGEFRDLLAKSRDFVFFLIDHFVETNDLESLAGRRSIIDNVFPVLKSLPNTLLDLYLRYLADKLHVKETSLYDDLESFRLPNERKERLGAQTVYEKQQWPLVALILSIVLARPNLFELIRNELTENDFLADFKTIYNLLTDQYNSTRTGFLEWNFEGFADLQEKIDVLLLYFEAHYQHFADEIIEKALGELLDRLVMERRKSAMRELQKEMKQAEIAGDSAKVMKLLAEQKDLLNA